MPSSTVSSTPPTASSCAATRSAGPPTASRTPPPQVLCRSAPRRPQNPASPTSSLTKGGETTHPGGPDDEHDTDPAGVHYSRVSKIVRDDRAHQPQGGDSGECS